MNNIFSKNNLKLIGVLVGVFIAVSFVVAGLYYFVCRVTGTTTTGSDIANIFVASATLLGPIILVFTLNAWKEQHNKNLSKEVALVCWDAVTLNMNLLEDYILKARDLQLITKMGFVDGVHNTLLGEVSKLKTDYDKSNQSALVQVAKVKALCSKSLDMDNYMESINATSLDISKIRRLKLFHTERSEQVILEMNRSASQLLSHLETIIRA